MDREPGQPRETPLLPEDALPCIWMAAGLLYYKLCDREYDCEHCAFDAALRGGKVESVEPHEIGIQPVVWEFRQDRRYHNSHGWVKDVNGAEVRYGLDMFAARLLAQVTSVVLPAPKTRLHSGRPACWVMDESEMIPLRSPVSGTVSRINSEVQRHPALIASSPYDNGWLLEVLCDKNFKEQVDLLHAADMQEITADQLKKTVQKHLRGMSVAAEVGPTLADGGEQLTDLRRILGTKGFHALVLELLG